MANAGIATALGLPLPGALSQPTQTNTDEAPWAFSVEDAITELGRVSKLPRTSTGFPELDATLGGGLTPGEMTALVGGTGGGKTALAVQIAAKMAESAPVVFVSYELPAPQLIARIASQRIPSASWLDVLRGRVPHEAIRTAVPDRILFLESPTIEQLRRTIAYITTDRGKAPVVFVDYLQLFARQLKEADTRLAVSGASGTFRKLAQDTGVPMLVVSSTSRGNTEQIANARGNHPANLLGVGKESGDIEYDVAALLVVGHTGETDDTGRNISTLTVAKNRYGRQTHLDFRFGGAGGLWTEVGVYDKETAGPSKGLLRRYAKLVVEVKAKPGFYSSSSLATQKGFSGKQKNLIHIKALIEAKVFQQGANDRRLYLTEPNWDAFLAENGGLS